MMAKSKILGRIALTCAIIAMLSLSAQAQRGGRGGPQGGGRGGGGFGGFPRGMTTIFSMIPRESPAQFAMRTDVKKELGVTEDQETELRDVARSMGRREMMEQLGIDFRSLGDMSEDEVADLTKDVQVKVAKLQTKMMDDVAGVLSSKQTKRLKELQFQFTALSRRQPASALRAADINVDEDDEKKITDALADVEKDLAAKIAKLRRTAYVEALSSVVSASKLESLMGEVFAFEATGGGQFGGFGGFGGGRGGPGQAGGGGRRGGGGGDGNARPRRPGGGNDQEEEEEENTNPRRRR